MISPTNTILKNGQLFTMYLKSILENFQVAFKFCMNEKSYVTFGKLIRVTQPKFDLVALSDFTFLKLNVSAF
jgi:hypothetical protein